MKSIEQEFFSYKLKVSNILLEHFIDKDENLRNKMIEVSRHIRKFYLLDKISFYVRNKGADTSSQEILDYIEELEFKIGAKKK